MHHCLLLLCDVFFFFFLNISSPPISVNIFIHFFKGMEMEAKKKVGQAT